MEDQTQIKPDAPVIDATDDTDIPVDAGEPDPNVIPAGPAATSFADAVASFGGLDVRAPVEALPDEPAETVEEECGTVSEEAISSLLRPKSKWEHGQFTQDGKIIVYSETGYDFVVRTGNAIELTPLDVADFVFVVGSPSHINSQRTGLRLFNVDEDFTLVDLSLGEDGAEVAQEDVAPSLQEDQAKPKPETLQTAETTGQDFNALMFRTAALNAAASICQGTGASSYEVTAKAEDLMVWLQGDAGSADFEEPRD